MGNFKLRMAVIICFILGIVLWYVLARAQTTQQYTELHVFNPYSSVSVKIEVKCDHNYKTKKYDFYKVFIIKRSSNIVIQAPVGLKKCEIWPIDMKMFGDLKGSVQ